LGTLIADLKAAGTLEETLIVAIGEFGRTVGAPNQGVRTRSLSPTILIPRRSADKKKQIRRQTDDSGSATVDPGWFRNRYVRPEDVKATIYSALGIDWTTVRAR